MLTHQRIVVTNNTASLWGVFIVVKTTQSEVGQLALVLFDVENVGVSVHVLESVRIHFDKSFKPFKTYVKFYIIID